MIGLERMVSGIARLGNINVTCKPMIWYQKFAEFLGVEDNLRVRSEDTLKDDVQLYWLDFTVQYPGKFSLTLSLTFSLSLSLSLSLTLSLSFSLSLSLSHSLSPSLSFSLSLPLSLFLSLSLSLSLSPSLSLSLSTTLPLSHLFLVYPSHFCLSLSEVNYELIVFNTPGYLNIGVEHTCVLYGI